ncbi:MAG TPA: hypothetical protein VIJ19_00360 [Opitutaceae bacterium]
MKIQDITVSPSQWEASGPGYIHDVGPDISSGGVLVYFQAQIQLVGDYVQLPYTSSSAGAPGYQLLYSTIFNPAVAGVVRIIYESPNGTTAAPTQSMTFRVITFSGS